MQSQIADAERQANSLLDSAKRLLEEYNKKMEQYRKMQEVIKSLRIEQEAVEDAWGWYSQK